METHFAHALEVLTELGVDLVGGHLEVDAVTGVLLSIQEPLGHVVFQGLRDHVRDLVHLLFGQLACSTP